MLNGESSSEEDSSQPAMSGEVVNALNTLTSHQVAQPSCSACGRPFDEAANGRASADCQWAEYPENVVPQSNHGQESQPRFTSSTVVTGHSDHCFGMGIQERRVAEAELTSQKFCFVVVLERGHISRRTRTYPIYFIPEEEFEERFANIDRMEKVVYQSSYLDVKDLPTTQSHRRYVVPIGRQLVVKAKLVRGEKFQITSSDKFVAPMDKILQESKDRLGTTSIALQVTCTGSTKEWCEDMVYLSLSTGTSQTFHLTFSVVSYCSENVWLMRASPACMPQEDIEALRRCIIPLLDKIHNMSKINRHLWMLKILEEEDVDEISSIASTKGQAADLLKRLKFRGDVLDIFIDVLWVTHNRSAAQILQQSRCRASQTDNH